MRIAGFLSVVLLTVAGLGAELGQTVASGQSATPNPSPVLLELFTSEGCSTCPPADKLLTELDQNQLIKGVEVIALSEHVDYWNRLGWKDPFSSAQFSQRQNDYSRALNLEEVYTPQMVVDGRTAFVGSKRAIALDAIAKATRVPKAIVSVAVAASARSSVTLTVQVASVPDISRGDKAEVMLAVAESGLVSKVSRGENSGRELGHSAVTRKLTKIGTVDGKGFSSEAVVHLESIWKRQNVKIAVFVQERASRRVLGAAAVRLTAES
ncbi:MAG TPA: DUF1223 domain-containing protein [Blastocatellia bacterium]|nr:DUF1223 domain-containing protein [Blastocatellia bacterium]